MKPTPETFNQKAAIVASRIVRMRRVRDTAIRRGDEATLLSVREPLQRAVAALHTFNRARKGLPYA